MQVSKAFTFYDWCDAGVSKVQYAKSGNSNSKLHGKIIHFKTKMEKNFACLAVPILHLKAWDYPAKNQMRKFHFCSVRKRWIIKSIRHKTEKTSNSKSLDEFTTTTNNSIYETIIKNNQFKVQLLSAEIIYDEFILHSNGTYSDEFRVVFFDKQTDFCIPKHSQIMGKN